MNYHFFFKKIQEKDIYIFFFGKSITHTQISKIENISVQLTFFRKGLSSTLGRKIRAFLNL